MIGKSGTDDSLPALKVETWVTRTIRVPGRIRQTVKIAPQPLLPGA
ncbi:MAG: hypothetical protein ABSC48_10500 [Terracidiphilus sp.]